MKRNELLLSITRCPELALAQANANHSCAGVVGVQEGCSGGGYQVPEPWTGHIETAPIIFISSIPGIANNEHFPRKDWSDANTIDFFQRRFDEDAGYTVQMPSESQHYQGLRRRWGTANRRTPCEVLEQRSQNRSGDSWPAANPWH